MSINPSPFPGVGVGSHNLPDRCSMLLPGTQLSDLQLTHCMPGAETGWQRAPCLGLPQFKGYQTLSLASWQPDTRMQILHLLITCP